MPTQNIYDLVDTWNAAGTTFTAVKMNVTDTASAAGSLLMDLQVGGSSRFNVGKTGSLKLGVSPTGTNQAGTNVIIQGSQGTGTGAGGSIIFQVAPAGTTGTAQNALTTALTITSDKIFSAGGMRGQDGYVGFYSTIADALTPTNAQRTILFTTASGNPKITLNANSTIGFSSATSGDVTEIADTILRRDAPNTLALRNGAAAQTFRVYNTTDGTNSEFGKIAWSSNVFQIGTEKAGTGTARALHLQTDGVTRLQIGSGLTISGASVAQLDGADFYTGSGGVLTVRSSSNGYSGATLYSSGEGLLRVSGGTGTDIRMMFGGMTSSFPALKRSTTVLQARLADDSAFATIQGKLRADVNAVAETPTATHTITITDAAGTAYKVLCVAA